MKSSKSQVVFLLRLRAPAGNDGIGALRDLLKVAGRRLGMRAIEAREEKEAPPGAKSPDLKQEA
jgi:hypothetical protein